MTVDLAAAYGVDPELLGHNRKLTRSGLRKVLKRVYELQAAREHADWELLWRSNVFARTEALHTWHRRIPKNAYAIDKARVLWYLKRGSVPLTGDARRAWTWAKS